MKKLNDEKLRIDLQYFAEGEEDNNTNNEGGEDKSNNEDQNSNNSGKEPKTYTDAELQRIMAKEKKQGKSAGKSELMKELGIDNLDDFKSSLEDFKKYQESQKSEAEKANEKINKAANEKADAERKLKIAEAKVEAMKSGVNPQFVDDVITLALSKKEDGEELADVIEAMKETHKMFFKEGTDENNGTGNQPQNKKVPSKVEGIGERLAKAKATNSSTKSSYFNNK